jgi:hypothetical protein
MVDISLRAPRGARLFTHPRGPCPARGGLRLFHGALMQILIVTLFVALCAYGAYVALSATEAGTLIAPSQGRLQSVEAALQ